MSSSFESFFIKLATADKELKKYLSQTTKDDNDSMTYFSSRGVTLFDNEDSEQIEKIARNIDAGPRPLQKTGGIAIPNNNPTVAKKVVKKIAKPVQQMPLPKVTADDLFGPGSGMKMDSGSEMRSTNAERTDAILGSYLDSETRYDDNDNRSGYDDGRDYGYERVLGQIITERYANQYGGKGGEDASMVEVNTMLRKMGSSGESRIRRGGSNIIDDDYGDVGLYRSSGGGSGGGGSADGLDASAFVDPKDFADYAGVDYVNAETNRGIVLSPRMDGKGSSNKVESQAQSRPTFKNTAQPAKVNLPEKKSVDRFAAISTGIKKDSSSKTNLSSSKRLSLRFQKIEK